MFVDLFGVGFERYMQMGLQWNDCLNWMTGILYADRVTTVSLAMRMRLWLLNMVVAWTQILRIGLAKVTGIVNECRSCNPETDLLTPSLISQIFQVKAAPTGSSRTCWSACSRWCSFVWDRLVWRQKGFDIEVVEEVASTFARIFRLCIEF